MPRSVYELPLKEDARVQCERSEWDQWFGFCPGLVAWEGRCMIQLGSALDDILLFLLL